jgi:hypothetical protein
MYQQLVLNRKLLVFAHVVVGFLSVVWYLSQIDFGHFPYWKSRSGLGVIFIAAPAIVPYVISAVYSWQVVTHRRLGVFLFLVVLVAGAGLMGLLLSGVLGIEVNGIQWLVTAGAQAGVYLWAAELLLHVV